MPFLVSRTATERGWADVIAPEQLSDDRLRIRVGTLEAGDEWSVDAPVEGLLWFQLLSGSVREIRETFSTDHVVMLARALVRVTASESTSVFVAEVPRWSTTTPGLRCHGLCTTGLGACPDSEHDARQRIYLASPKLWGTPR